MSDYEFTLATLEEAAPHVATLRKALADVGVGPVPGMDPDLQLVLNALRQQCDGWLLHELVAEVERSVEDVERVLRELARRGLAERMVASDGVMRWWATRRKSP